MLQGIPTGYADGEVIFEQGDPAADMYLIVYGHVRIVRESGGAGVDLAILGPGDFFGEMGLFAPGPRTATAVADGPAEVEVIDVATFKSAVPEPVVWRMLARMSERIRDAYEVMDSVTGSESEPLT